MTSIMAEHCRTELDILALREPRNRTTDLRTRRHRLRETGVFGRVADVSRRRDRSYNGGAGETCRRVHAEGRQRTLLWRCRDGVAHSGVPPVRRRVAGGRNRGTHHGFVEGELFLRSASGERTGHRRTNAMASGSAVLGGERIPGVLAVAAPRSGGRRS